MKKPIAIIFVMLIGGILLSGCLSENEKIAINGAGATFPYPLIAKWSAEYHKLHPEIQINYQSIGSGGGIQQITAKTVDFGASDAPLTEEEYKKIPGILHIPETIGAVVIAYNLPNTKKGLKLTGNIISDIYLGNIKKWNDPKITSLNPNFTLPDKEIIVVHRSDGSGTTFVFTDYLSSVSDEWKSKIGKGKSVNWPIGLGGKGNEGVSGILNQNPYSIGYLEIAYAKLRNIPYAYIQNKEGYFIEPKISTISNAADSVKLPDSGDMSWSDVSIVNPSGKDSYPISSFTYILVYKNQDDKEKGKELVKFLSWIIHDGQKYSSELLYAPLPESVVKLNENTIKLIN